MDSVDRWWPQAPTRDTAVPLSHGEVNLVQSRITGTCEVVKLRVTLVTRKAREAMVIKLQYLSLLSRKTEVTSINASTLKCLSPKKESTFT